ncbi:MAG: NADPH-dependent FMN reductase [Desulfitobacterium sp.]
MSNVMKIIGISGSLRRNSYNTAALKAAQELQPEGVFIEIADISQIPFFNEDIEAEGVPSVVEEFKKKIVAADALLIATPEYNYSIPPALKNALDWASRAGKPLDGKALGIMSASTGMLGGARVQYHLRQVCVGLNLQPLNKPEVFIMNAHTKFDKNGTLNDDFTRNAISKLIQGLVSKTLQLQK